MESRPGEAAEHVHAAGEPRIVASLVTIRAFDGVHREHQALVGRTIRSARARGLPPVAWTFDPPSKVFFGRAESLVSLKEKIDRFRFLGSDHVVAAKFDDAFRWRSTEVFLAELAQLDPAMVWAGTDFRFGASKAGTVPLLVECFPTWAMKLVRCAAGKIVSSRRIRGLMSFGSFDAAAALQGWSRAGSLPSHGRMGLQVAGKAP